MVVSNPHELRGFAVSSRGPLGKAPSIEKPASAEEGLAVEAKWW